MVYFNKIFAEIPKLHLWNGVYEYGGFGINELKNIQLLLETLGCNESSVIVETGAGLSTLIFLASKPKKLITISVDPSGGLKNRILNWASLNCVPIEPLEYYDVATELMLPTIAFSGQKANLCLIDGGHGWPTVFVDFCYLNMMLLQDGFLILDDIQLYSVKELFNLLCTQPGWQLHSKIGPKTVVFKKLWDQKILPDFGGQPYILSKPRLLPEIIIKGDS